MVANACAPKSVCFPRACACADRSDHRARPLTRVFKRLSAPRGPHLTSALGAVVHGPLVPVLVHDAVVDADAAVDADAVLNQLVLVGLGERKRGNILFMD